MKTKNIPSAYELYFTNKGQKHSNRLTRLFGENILIIDVFQLLGRLKATAFTGFSSN